MKILAALLLAVFPSIAAAQLVAATQLLGAQVLGPAGKTLGYITDLVLERHTGEVRYAVLYAEGGTAPGPGQAVFAVPLQALRPGVQRDTLVLAGRDEFPLPQESAPVVRAKTLLGARVADLWIALERATVVGVVLENESGERHTVPFSDFAGTASQGR